MTVHILTKKKIQIVTKMALDDNDTNIVTDNDSYLSLLLPDAGDHVVHAVQALPMPEYPVVRNQHRSKNPGHPNLARPVIADANLKTFVVLNSSYGKKVL